MPYKPIYTLEELQTYLSGATLVAFDFETAPDNKYRHAEKAALDVHKAHIAGISFSVAESDGIYLPLSHRVGQNAADPDSIWKWLTGFFADSSITKIAHNLAFESAFLYVRGIVIQEPVYDTIAAAQLVYKNEKEFRSLGDCGLKTLVPEYFHEQLPSYSKTVGGLHFDELDPSAERTVRYACADADYTLRLYHLLNNWFDRFLPKHRFIVEKVESPTAVYVGIMRYNGLPIDRSLMERKGAEAEKKLVELKGKITFIIGDINIGANAGTAAFKRYLFDTLKLPKMKLTAKEQDALDDEAIILLKEWCEQNRPVLTELLSLVQEYRRWGKIKSTYIDGYIKYINNATGRLHPDLMPLATETGRFASKNPNCQNIGMDKLYYAKITEDNNGEETYGTPISLAKAIKADLSIELAEAVLYADDGAAYVIKDFKSGKLSLGVDDIGVTAAQDLTGAVVDSNGVLVSASENEGAPVAVGFRALKPDNRYRYFWLYRVKFGVPSTNLQTKGDSITFQNPTIEGTILRRNRLDGMGKHPWKSEVTEGDPGVAEDTITGWYADVYEPVYSGAGVGGE